MSSIIPGYEYDIFISYRHNDNRSGWVTEFVNALQEELAATIKEPLSIYFDKNPHDGLLETHNVDKSLEGKLKCLIFIPIISQTYCDTKSFAWQHEFVAFNKLAKEDQFGRDIKLSNGNVASRILPIKIHDLDVEDKSLLENEIGGVLRAIEFIYKEVGVNRPLKSTDIKGDNQSKTDYGNQVNKVANAVKELITVLKNPAARSSPATINHQRTIGQTRNKNPIIFSLVSLLILLASYFIYQRLSTTKQQLKIEKSIAVLPFIDMSQNHDQEYFGDGLSEELLNKLAKIQELKVTARTSSFAFKNKNEDLRVIGHKLGVAHILQGSVRKNGNSLRITAQLISVNDGSHLWSETYNRTLDDIFKVQDEIAEAVIEQLKAKIFNETKSVAIIMKPEAYNLYLEGKHFATIPNKENLNKAEAKLKEALVVDGESAAIWSTLANVYVEQYGRAYRPNGYRLALDAANKAIQLNPNLAEGHAVRSLIFFQFDWDFVSADREAKWAVNLDSTNTFVLRNYAHSAKAMGRLDEALKYYKKALDVDPLSPASHAGLFRTYVNLGNFKAAEMHARKTIELAPDFTAAYYDLALVLLKNGKAEEALKTIEMAVDWKLDGLPIIYYSLNRKVEARVALQDLIAKNGTTDAYQIAQCYAYFGETDKAFEWLELAYQLHDPGLAEMLADILLKPLNSDPRWQPFLEKVGLMK